jgi:hypothetical protein
MMDRGPRWPDCLMTGHRNDTPPCLAVVLMIVVNDTARPAINYWARRWL